MSSRPGFRRRAWAIALASFAVGLLLGECGLRFLLFSSVASSWGAARALRHETLYASSLGPDHWKLAVLFGPERARRAHPRFDARFGWLSADVDPETFEHSGESTLAGRRPVLLFGDSYAQCVQRAGECWQGLLERSPLADRYRLLNYGVGGYGVDQALLLMTSVLPRFEGQDPVVVFGILVDDDLDRSWLPLRGHPKPWFELVDGELRRHGVEDADPASCVEAHPPRISSYLLRLVLFGSGLVARSTATNWTEGADLVAEKKTLNARLVDEVQAAWRERRVTGFFVLFHGREALASARAGRPATWQDQFLHQALAERGLAFVSSIPPLLDALEQAGLGLDELYYPKPPGENHYTPAANEAVFRPLANAIEAAGGGR